MKIQCVLCDEVEEIGPDSTLGKKLRNRLLYTYVCQKCHQRIARKTEIRKKEGKLRKPTFHKNHDDW